MESTELELVSASLRADSKDIKTYLELLAEKLTATYPGQVRVEKRGLLPGTKTVRRIVVLLGDDRYTIETDNWAITCLRSSMVRGVALKNDQLALDAWIDELSRSVVRQAEESEQGRLALERLLI
jgi:hypothetical protein